MTAKLTKINSASATVRYFEKDSGVAPVSDAAGYYAGHDLGGKPASAWFGRGARALNLRGAVGSEEFQQVLSGKVPRKGIRLGRKVVVDEETGKTALEHNPGDDLTFSAPKSVSIAALHCKEAGAMKAHDKAVKATAAWVERVSIQSRRNQRRENTGAMVAAMFRHETSRNHDPQLHTHMVIANMTRRGDGEWTSIDRGGVSLNERVIESYYHNELARNLREEGYRLRPVQYGAKRVFEIEGYTQDILEAFSTRKRDILKDLEQRGIKYSAGAASRAALRTRRKKEEIPREELHRMWNETAARLGFENPSSKKDRRRNRKEMRDLRGRGIEDPLGRDIDADLHRAIRTALEHLGYHTPVVADTALKATVMNHLAGRVTLERIDQVLAGMERDGHLYRSKKPGSRGAWVTREALEAEKGVIKHMWKGRGQALAIRPGFEAARELEGRGLTPGQSAAIEAILTSTDRVSGVQGYAGTGKTTMLRTLVEKAGNRRVIGLAPTVGASMLLGSETGIPSETLQKFLVKHGDISRMDDGKLEELRKEYAGTDLVVDEASMIGTRQMEELFAITGRLGIERLVLVGDKKQLRSVEAGQPFTQLQKKGMATAVMEDIVRQRHEGLRLSVQMMLAGNVSCALERLGDEEDKSGQLVEVGREDLHRTAARLYLGLDRSERLGTLVMAQTNHEREEINARIREGLMEEGHIGGETYEGVRLVNRHLTPTEKADALNYEAGDILVFHSRYRTKEGTDHFEVKRVDADGRLLVEADNGEWKHFDPAKGQMAQRYEVFEQREFGFMENDLVRITRNDPDLRGRGVVNGAEAVVERIGPKRVTLRVKGEDPEAKGRTVSIDRGHDALKHLDHGYCRTTYSTQGVTSDRVIAVADSGLGHLNDQRNLYVQISRPREEAVVVTDDIVQLGDNLARYAGECMSALEAVEPPEAEVAREEEIRMRTHMDIGTGEDREIEMPWLDAGIPSSDEFQDRPMASPALGAGIDLPETVMPDRLAVETAAMAQEWDAGMEPDGAGVATPAHVAAAMGRGIEWEMAGEDYQHEDGQTPGMAPVIEQRGEEGQPAPELEGRGIDLDGPTQPPGREPEDDREIGIGLPPAVEAELPSPTIEGRGIEPRMEPAPDGPDTEDGCEGENDTGPEKGRDIAEDQRHTEKPKGGSAVSEDTQPEIPGLLSGAPDRDGQAKDGAGKKPDRDDEPEIDHAPSGEVIPAATADEGRSIIGDGASVESGLPDAEPDKGHEVPVAGKSGDGTVVDEGWEVHPSDRGTDETAPEDPSMEPDAKVPQLEPEYTPIGEYGSGQEVGDDTLEVIGEDKTHEPDLPELADDEAELEDEQEQEPEPPAPSPYIGLDPEDVPGPVGFDMDDHALRKVRLPDTGERAEGVIGTGYAEAGEEGLNAKAAEIWWKTGKARDVTGILAMPVRQQEIALIIRARLKEEGQLQGDPVEVGRRVMVPLVGREKTADRFELGDTLILGNATGGTGIKPDSTVVVLGWDHEKNPSNIAVRGIKPDGSEITALLDPAIVLDGQMFRHIPMELMVGDRIQWRTDIREAGVSAGERATITAIEESGKIELASDRTGGKGRWAMPISHRAFAACDYAFNLSPLDIQMGAAENIVAVLDANRPDTGIVNEVRREIGREVGNTVVVTDDKHKLNNRLERLDKALNVGHGIEGILIGRDGAERKQDRRQSLGRGRGI